MLCPLTSIHNTSVLDNAIKKINFNGETNIGDALDKAFDQITNAGKGEKTVIILLTDGENTAPYKQNHLKFKKINSPIYTIGLKGNLDNAFLNEIAESTGGKYYNIPESFQIQDIYFEVVNKEENRKIFISQDILLDPFQTIKVPFHPDTTIRKLNIVYY